MVEVVGSLLPAKEGPSCPSRTRRYACMKRQHNGIECNGCTMHSHYCSTTETETASSRIVPLLHPTYNQEQVRVYQKDKDGTFAVMEAQHHAHSEEELHNAEPVYPCFARRCSCVRSRRQCNTLVYRYIPYMSLSKSKCQKEKTRGNYVEVEKEKGPKKEHREERSNKIALLPTQSNR